MKINQNLTIIIPFFNSVKYIEKSIKLLTNQTNLNYKVIFIDDCSNDNSYDLCKSLIRENKNFSILKNSNHKGVGFARALGLQTCKTEYVTFFDIDDIYTPTAIQTILNEIELLPDTDIFVYNHSFLDMNINNSEITFSSNTDNYNELFDTNSPLICHLWNKVFKTSLLKNLDYNFLSQITFSEDLFICIYAFLNTNKISIVNDSYYTYVKNSNSCVTSRSERSFFDNVAVNQKLLELVKDKSNPAIEAYIKRDSYNSFGQFIFPNKKNNFQWKQPHFNEFRKFQIHENLIPEKTFFIYKLYISLINQKQDKSALLIWYLLKLKEMVKNYKRQKSKGK